MRNRFFCIIAILLLLQAATAVEFTFIVSRLPNSSGYNLVSFPVLPANDSIANVIGTQLPVGTSVLWFNNAIGAFQLTSRYTTGWRWSNGFRLSRGKGYYIVLRWDSPLTSYQVTVEGDTVTATSWDMGTIGVGYNMVGSVWYSPNPIANSNVMESGLRGGYFAGMSDKITTVDISKFLVVWLNSQNQWVTSDFTNFEPGKGYYIIRRAGRTPPTFQWQNTR
ncbi:MAG: hypothetical protein OEM52_01975 [bacterium]|nr:hypothetical protein [bacterium]